MQKLQMTCAMFLLFVILISPAQAAETRSRDEMRQAYLVNSNKTKGELYVNEPSAENPYEAGSLSAAALEAALHEVNFIRWLAGLEALEPNDELNSLAQHGAVLMAANQRLSHAPEQPADMKDEFYEMGKAAAASCNLIMFNWFDEGLLSEAAVEFARDDGAGNRLVLGHRRWLLYPAMKYTGFGLAADAEGRSYAAMYVMDESNAGADYDMILWPSPGAFPAEYMTKETPWSVSLNPDKYDLDKSALRITMTESGAGAQFVFDTMEETSDSAQYFVLGGGRLGDGPAYIFRPDLSEYDELMYGYSQNQVWTVEIEGVFLKGGALADKIEYTVEMASLTPIDPAAVEIQPRTLHLKAGESAVLRAQVIPQWADDLSVVWRSSDAEIASVDDEGTVRAQKAGKCTIIAESVNGRYDEIDITVTE